MKILFRQPDTDLLGIVSPLSACGIRQCYVKRLSMDRDTKIITKKSHHHTSFEIHIITKGWQSYETEETQFCVPEGSLLLLPPLLTHRTTASAPGTEKFSIVFTVRKTAKMPLLVSDIKSVVCTQTPPQIMNILNDVLCRHKPQNELDALLLENRVFEMVITLLRLSNARECTSPVLETDTDLRLTLAKQFIWDNIRLPLTVADIAAYTNLSEKQITRLFLQHDGIPPQKYIHTQRANMLAQLAADDTLSFREIAEQMHFSSEYYFNSFFKKHLGMPPGAYRKAHRNT